LVKKADKVVKEVKPTVKESVDAFVSMCSKDGERRIIQVYYGSSYNIGGKEYIFDVDVMVAMLETELVTVSSQTEKFVNIIGIVQE